MTSFRMNEPGWKGRSHESSGASVSPTAVEWSLSPLRLTLLAVLFGLLTGVLELTQWLIRKRASPAEFRSAVFR